MSISFIINRDLLLKLNILISGYFYEIYKYNTIIFMNNCIHKIWILFCILFYISFCISKNTKNILYLEIELIKI